MTSRARIDRPGFLLMLLFMLLGGLAAMIGCFGHETLQAQVLAQRGSQRGSKTQQTSGFSAPNAFVVPIEGAVDFRMAALLRRALAEADAAGASRLILAIDSPGGEVSWMEEMTTMLEQLKGQPIDTVAWVKNQAYSAAAVLALACKRVWVSPRATIGAAVPVIGGGLRGLLEDEVRFKYIAAFRAEFAKIAAHHGANVQRLAEAMVDGRMQLISVRYRGEDGVVRNKLLELDEVQKLRDKKGVSILDETKVSKAGEPLVLDKDEALRYGVAEGEAANLDELARELGVDPASIQRVESNWSEELAGFLYSIRMFLLIGGILMTVIALKAPGTGVPEALALLCFVFFFAGQFLVGLAAWTEILLFFAGICLILVEFFLIPGTIVAGVLGFLCVVAALFLSLQVFALPSTAMQDDIMTRNLMSLLIAILIVSVLAFLFSRFLPKIPLFKRLMLEGGPGLGARSTSATIERVQSPLLGRRGKTLTDLRPTGRLEIDGEPIDVVSNGAFLPSGLEVQVVKVEGNRVVVVPTSEISGGGGGARSAEGGLVAIHWLVFMLFCGLLLLVAEVFFVSFGVIGTIAAVLTVSTVFLAFEHGTWIGSGFLGAVLVLGPTTLLLALRILPKTPFGKRLILAGPSGKSTAMGERFDACVGKRGSTLTPLRPVGTILVDGQRFDALSRGEAIAKGQEVEVLRAELGQLIVRKVRSS